MSSPGTGRSSVEVHWGQWKGCFQDLRWEDRLWVHGVTRRDQGDMKEEACRRDALREWKIPVERVLFLKQVHGNQVRLADRNFLETGILQEASVLEGDGWITELSGAALGIFVADCMPVFFASSRGPVGIAHAGWRGLQAGILSSMVRSFSEYFAIASRDLDVTIGPHLRSCCYRVGEEFEGRFPGDVLRRVGGKIFLDMQLAAHRQLLQLGIPEDRLGRTSYCTGCRSDSFFSFRRDKTDHRMMAFMARR